jgi:peroxiredoxin
MKEEKKIKADILSDPGNKVAEQYGIKYKMPNDLVTVYTTQLGIRVDEYNGDDSWTLPMPARLIIDQNGTIRYAEIYPDYRVRPEPEDTLAALNK